ncbi:DUF6686 family protein [Spirosoma daeguense]
MTTCQPNMLFYQERFCIAQCQHCQRVGLTFQNLLLGFTQDEFTVFCRIIDGVNFDKSSAVMPDGQPQLIVNTGHSDIQFSLLKPEFERLKSGLHDALRRMNLHKLLKLQTN